MGGASGGSTKSSPRLDLIILQYPVAYSMRTSQNKVRQFHQKANALINDKPTQPSVEVCELRDRLISEELQELREAMGLTGLHYSHEGVADAIADLLYVVLGTAVSCGIDAQECFNEVHRSNMTKFIDGYAREDGKWVKGPSYSKADMGSIISRQLDPNVNDSIEINDKVKLHSNFVPNVKNGSVGVVKDIHGDNEAFDILFEVNGERVYRIVDASLVTKSH